MATILKSGKPLTVNPLKTSAFMGAALAYLGVARAIPLLHSAQGCSAFAKVYFVRHFREPIPLQTSAMDHVATVMNADENLIEALALLCGKQKPDLIGIATSGLAETQGTDVARILKTFRKRHPEFAATRVVWASTPDFRGGFEQGYAEALYSLIDQLLPAPRPTARLPDPASRNINLLCPAWMTPGDQEALAAMVEDFGLEPVLVPDLAHSLDGHLGAPRLNPTSQGGVNVARLENLADARATLVFGRSLRQVGARLAALTGVPSQQFDTLYGLQATDALLQTLASLSGQPVPTRYTRQRQQLQDALLDSHFMLTGARLAIAAEPDHLAQWLGLLAEVGAEVVSPVVPSAPDWLAELATDTITVGDLLDWEDGARAGRAELLIANSHGAAAAQRLGVPLLRAGFPQYDWLGGFQRVWIGYTGARQACFDLGNLWTEHHEQRSHSRVYVSRYRRPENHSAGRQPGALHEPQARVCQH